MNRFQMISNNAGIFRKPSVELSTVEMPKSFTEYRYESCLFTETDSEVLARYDTLTDAIIGHNKLANQHNLKLVE